MLWKLEKGASSDGGGKAAPSSILGAKRSARGGIISPRVNCRVLEMRMEGMRPEYVETVGYYTAFALTLGQKTRNNLFSGPG